MNVAKNTLLLLIFSIATGIIFVLAASCIKSNFNKRIETIFHHVDPFFNKLTPTLQCYYWVIAFAALDLTSPLLTGAAVTIIFDIALGLRNSQSLFQYENTHTLQATEGKKRNFRNAYSILGHLCSQTSKRLNHYLLLSLAMSTLSSPHATAIFGIDSSNSINALITINSALFLVCFYFLLHATFTATIKLTAHCYR